MLRSRRNQLSSDPSQSAGSSAGFPRTRNTLEVDSRLSSCPDERQVNRRRQDESNQGGPSVPHNSMDSSLIDLSETVELSHDGEVFGNAQSNYLNIISNIRTMALEHHEEETEITYEAETTAEIILIESDDNSEVENDLLEDQENSGHYLGESASVDATIDLTDSPLPSRRASTLIEDVSSGPNTGDDMELASSDLDTTSNFDEEAMRSFCASLKCPICFDHFIVIQRKGIQLCSTLCGHVLCLTCARACIDGKNECPTCRKRLHRNPPYNYHPLFIF